MSFCREYIWSISNKELKGYFVKLDIKKYVYMYILID